MTPWKGGFAAIPIDIGPTLRELETVAELKVFLYVHARYWRADNFDDDEAVLKRAWIASKTNLSVRSVATALASLESKGYLTITRDAGRASQFRTDFPAVPLRSTKPAEVDDEGGCEAGFTGEADCTGGVKQASHPDSALVIEESKEEPSLPPSLESNPSIPGYMLTTANLNKALRQAGKDLKLTGLPPPAIRTRLSGIDQNRRRAGQEEWETWRTKLWQQMVDWKADPSIGTVWQAVGALVPGSTPFRGPGGDMPRLDYRRSLGLGVQDGAPLSDEPEARKRIRANFAYVGYNLGRVLDWKMSDVEEWYLSDTEAVVKSLGKIVEDMKGKGASSDAVFGMLHKRAQAAGRKQTQEIDAPEAAAKECLRFKTIYQYYSKAEAKALGTKMLERYGSIDKVRERVDYYLGLPKPRIPDLEDLGFEIPGQLPYFKGIPEATA